jgi:hypothetical protein
MSALGGIAGRVSLQAPTTAAIAGTLRTNAGLAPNHVAQQLSFAWMNLKNLAVRQMLPSEPRQVFTRELAVRYNF